MPGAELQLVQEVLAPTMTMREALLLQPQCRQQLDRLGRGLRIEGWRGLRIEGWRGLRIEGWRGLRIEGWRGLRIEGWRGLRIEDWRGLRIAAPLPA
jgi:hypothetical protein